jgi:cytoskeletal protein CcmA (bactofilin family)
MQENTSDTGRMPALSQPPAGERRIAVLGPTLRFKGDLYAEEDFIFQGRIQGSIHHTQRVVVGTQGVVSGNIHARAVVVDGAVEGDLYGKESVVIHETGRVNGSIFAPRVGISDGAVFNGRIDMNATAAVVNQPAPAQAAPTQAAPTMAPAPPKRVESPTLNPGQPISAEETEKILTPKVTVLPPPPRKVG